MVTWWPQRSPVALFTRNCVFTYQVRWSSLRFTVHWLVFLVLVSPYRFSLQFKWNHVLRTGLWLYGSIVVSRSCVTIGPVFLVSDQKDHICQIHVHLCVCVWAQTQWWYQLLWAVWAWTLWRKKKKRPVFLPNLKQGFHHLQIIPSSTESLTQLLLQLVITSGMEIALVTSWNTETYSV